MIFFMYFKMTCKFSNYFLLSCYLSITCGESGKMVAVQRLSNNPYAIRLNTVEVSDVANKEQLVPEKWWNLDDASVQAEICRYILPLMKGEVPQFKNEFGLNDYIIFE